MKYAVIIPHENKRPEMLREAVESIKSQTKPFDEIILIDKPKSTWVKINKAVSKSNCDAFVVLSDDDKLHPEYLSYTSALMEKWQLDIVSTFLQNFGDDDSIHGPSEHPFMTSLISKSIWEKVGGYEDVGIASDKDFYLRCQEAGAKRENLGKPLFLYRKHSQQWSNHGDWKESNKKIQLRHENKRNNTDN